jgi:hypothetical protein
MAALSGPCHRQRRAHTTQSIFERLFRSGACPFKKYKGDTGAPEAQFRIFMETGMKTVDFRRKMAPLSGN